MRDLKLQMCTTNYLLQVPLNCEENEFKVRIIAEMMRGTLKWLYGLSQRDMSSPHCSAVRLLMLGVSAFPVISAQVRVAGI